MRKCCWTNLNVPKECFFAVGCQGRAGWCTLGFRSVLNTPHTYIRRSPKCINPKSMKEPYEYMYISRNIYGPLKSNLDARYPASLATKCKECDVYNRIGSPRIGHDRQNSDIIGSTRLGPPTWCARRARRFITRTKQSADPTHTSGSRC